MVNPKVQSDPGDSLTLGTKEEQVTGEYRIWTKDGFYINGVLITEIDGIQGPVGPVGPPGVGGPYVYLHTQSTASAAWTVNHNLGTSPQVEVRNAGGQVVNAEIQHTSLNQAIIYFTSLQTGTARFS